MQLLQRTTRRLYRPSRWRKCYRRRKEMEMGKEKREMQGKLGWSKIKEGRGGRRSQGRKGEKEEWIWI